MRNQLIKATDHGMDGRCTGVDAGYFWIPGDMVFPEWNDEEYVERIKAIRTYIKDAYGVHVAYYDLRVVPEKDVEVLVDRWVKERANLARLINEREF